MDNEFGLGMWVCTIPWNQVSHKWLQGAIQTIIPMQSSIPNFLTAKVTTVQLNYINQLHPFESIRLTSPIMKICKFPSWSLFGIRRTYMKNLNSRDSTSNCCWMAWFQIPQFWLVMKSLSHKFTSQLETISFGVEKINFNDEFSWFSQLPFSHYFLWINGN